MTLTTTPPLIDYVENGVTLIHNVPFQFQGLEEIVCERIAGGVRTPCVEGADFTVSGGAGLTGTVTKTNGGVNGTVFRIRRVTTRGQPTDFTAHDTFPAEVAETSLDRLAAVNQEQEIAVTDLEERAVRVPLGETIAQLPPPADRKGTLFGFSPLTGIRELLTYANLSTVLAPLLQPLFSAIQKGDPGGNIMAIGLFLAGPTLNIPVGTDIVRTSGYSVTGKGGARYQYDAAVDAAYVIANPRSAFVSANGRGFRLSLDQRLNVCMFGAIGNDLANDGTAFVAALAFCFAVAAAGVSKAAPSLMVPFGQYYLGAQTLDLTYPINFLSEDAVSAAGHGGGVQLRWDDGCDGIRTQGNDTTGATATGPQAYAGAYGSRIGRFQLKGGWAGVEGEFHAVRLRAIAHVDVRAMNWSGDGLFLQAGSDVGEGNSNGWTGFVEAQYCRDGVRVDGANANIGECRVNVSWCRRWGVNDSSFLGTLWTGLSEVNGRVDLGSMPSAVHYLGNWYAVIAGQEVGASTNPPPLTQTDNAYWYWMNAGGPNPGVPDWFNGIVLRAGGSARTDNNNAQTVFLEFWSEYAQGPMQLVWPTQVIGGAQVSGAKGIAVIHQADTGLRVDGNFQVNGNLVVGPSDGSTNTADQTSFFDWHGAGFGLNWRRWTGAGIATIVAQVMGKYTQGLFLTGNPQITLFTGDPNGAPVAVATVTEDGIDINLNTIDSGFYAGGLKVVGGRQAAIAHDASGAVNQGSVNAIIDALRAHGLIAT